HVCHPTVIDSSIRAVLRLEKWGGFGRISGRQPVERTGVTVAPPGIKGIGDSRGALSVGCVRPDQGLHACVPFPFSNEFRREIPKTDLLKTTDVVARAGLLI
ncbi:hypothetical protein BaRGS_00024699, partial [Batillaria attramentaria]